MKKLLRVFALLSGVAVFGPGVTKGQVWNYVGAGLHSKPTAFCGMDNSLVVAFNHFTQPDFTDSIFLKKWNGSNWINLPGFAVNDSTLFTNVNEYKPRAVSLCYFQNDLFVLIRDYNKPFNDDFHPVYRILQLHDNIWNLLGTLTKVKTSSVKLLVFDNKLYCAGNFSGIDGLSATDLIYWEKNSWHSISSSKDQLNGVVSDAVVYNNALYISYKENDRVPSLKYWDGKSFSTVPVSQTLDVDYMLAADRLYLHGYERDEKRYTVLMRDGSGWVNIVPKNFYNFSISGDGSRGWVAFNKGIFAVGSFTYGQVSGNAAEWDGSKWKIRFYNNFYADSIYKLDNLLYGFSATSEDYNHIASMKMDYGKISGRVYKDLNMNCKRDGSEAAVRNMMVRIMPGPYYAMTDTAGYFEVPLPVDTYSVELIVPNHFSPASCVNTNFTYRMYTNTDTSLNVPLIPEKNVKDLAVNIIGVSSGMKARQGFTETYYIVCTNIGTAASGAGSVTIRFPSKLRLVNAVPSVATNSPSQLSWDFTNLQPDQQFKIKLQLNVPLAVPLYSNLNFNVNCSSSGDDNGGNNADSLIQEVRAAIDPNEKECMPAGEIKKNNVDKIEYLIRFQNTGNYFATRVQVIDTIDTSLPIQYISIDAASHDYVAWADKTGKAIHWEFNNIMLPDSATNEAGSQGYIRFSIPMKKNLPIGTEIRNKAYIFFDYQEPVVTNMTRNVIIENDNTDTSTGINMMPADHPVFTAYPNPASTELVVKFNVRSVNQKVFIMNMLGETVMQASYSGADQMTLDITRLPDGVYFVQSGDGLQVNKLIVHKH